MKKKRRSREFKNNSQVIDMEQARRDRQARHQAEERKQQAGTREEQLRNARRKTALRKRQSRRRALLAGIVAVMILALGLSVGHIIVLKHQLNDVMAQQQEYKQEKAELQKELENIDDTENLEQQARSQMGLIKPGETLYVFPDEMKD